MHEQETLFPIGDDELAATWLGRVQKANKHYDTWSRRFKCDEMEEYYYGFQWKDASQAVNYERYVINLIFSTIEVKLPSLLFKEPAFHVKPKPAKMDFDIESAAATADLKENALNTIFSDGETDVSEELELFVKDAFFRFGVIEVGYSANWILNPNAGRPILKSDNQPFTDESDNLLAEPKEIPENEKVYIRRIKPWRFRIGGLDGNTFRKCSWVGYYDYVRTKDLKENKSLKNIDKLQWSGARTEDFIYSNEKPHPEDEEILKTGDVTKVWHVWDIAAQMRYIFAESQSVTLFEESYDTLPLVPLRFVTSLRGWYPVPLAFNWKGPQDEYNETREAMRIHRRRTKRVYISREGAWEDDSELDKLENGPDMTILKSQVPVTEACQPLPAAPLDNTIKDSLVVTKDDFNIISATASEQRGESDRTTATQATIIDQRSQIREARGSTIVAVAFCKIARLVLLTLVRRMTLPFWVKVNVDSDESFLSEFQETKSNWQKITSSQLGDDEDFEVSLSLESISPIYNEQELQKLVKFLSLITQFPQVAFDATLVREVAYRCGYKNEKVIRRMAQMAQVAALGQVQQAQNSLNQQQGLPPTPGGNLAQTRVAQMQPPTVEQVANQLRGQVQ